MPGFESMNRGDIGCAHIHFEGNKVGEFRGYNGQVRLTEASAEEFLLELEFFDPENQKPAFSNEVVQFAQKQDAQGPG